VGLVNRTIQTQSYPLGESVGRRLIHSSPSYPTLPEKCETRLTSDSSNLKFTADCRLPSDTAVFCLYRIPLRSVLISCIGRIRCCPRRPSGYQPPAESYGPRTPSDKWEFRQLDDTLRSRDGPHISRTILCGSWSCY
jgi:hypothetical protein